MKTSILLTSIIFTIFVTAGITIYITEDKALINLENSIGKDYKVTYEKGLVIGKQGSETLFKSKYSVVCDGVVNRQQDQSKLTLQHEDQNNYFISQNTTYKTGVLERTLWINEEGVYDIVQFYPSSSLTDCIIQDKYLDYATEPSSDVQQFKRVFSLPGIKVQPSEKKIESVCVGKKCVVQTEWDRIIPAELNEFGQACLEPVSDAQKRTYNVVISEEINEQVDLDTDGLYTSFGSLYDLDSEQCVDPQAGGYGTFQIGYATNTFIISSFVGGTDANTFSERLYGLEPINPTVTVNRTGLVGEYLFSGDANDTSTIGNNASTVIALNQFQRYKCNGTSDIISFPAVAAQSTQLQNNFSFSGWIYPETMSGGPKNIWGYNGTPETNFIRLQYDSVGTRVVLSIADGTNFGLYTNGSTGCQPQANTWNYIGFSYVRSEPTVVSIINGNVCNTTSSNTSVLLTPTLIGPSFCGELGPGNYFNGSIESFRIYNRTISLEEHRLIQGYGVHFNGTQNNSNWTSPIYSQNYGSFDRWINITVKYVNESDEDLVGISYRTGSIIRPEQSSNLSPYIVSLYSFNNSAVNGDNNTWMNDTWGKNHLFCRINDNQSCPLTVEGVFNNENATDFDNNYTSGTWIINYSGVYTGTNGTTGINMSKNFTLMLWAKSSANSSGNTEQRWLYSFGRDVGPPTFDYWGGYGIYRQIGSASVNHKVQYCGKAFLSNGTQIVACTNPIFQEGEWHHLAITFNTTKFCLIADGTLRNCANTHGLEVNMSWPAGVVGDLNIMPCIGAVGAACNRSDILNFEGQVDDLVIMNRSIIADEIVNWNSYSTFQNLPNGTSITSGEDDIFTQIRLSLQTANATNVLRVLSFNVTSNYKPVQVEARAQFPLQTETDTNPRIICTASNCPATGNITAYNGTVVDHDNDTVKMIFSWEYTPSGVSSAIPFDLAYIPIEGNDSNTAGVNYAQDMKFTCTCRGDHSTDCFKPSDGYDGWGAYLFNSSHEQCQMLLNQSSLQSRANNLTTEFTFFARVKKIKIDRPSSFASIVQATQSNGSGAMRMDTNNNTQFQCRFDTSNSTNQVCPAIGNLSDLQWHTVALRYKAGFNDSNATLNVDKDLSSTVHVTGEVWGITNGTITFASGDRDAYVDDVHIYTEYLTDEQLWLVMDNQTNTIHSSAIDSGDTWTVKVTPNDRTTLGNTVNMSVAIAGSTTITEAVVNIYWKSARTFVNNTIRWFAVYFEINNSDHEAAIQESEPYNNTGQSYITTVAHPETRQMASERGRR